MSIRRKEDEPLFVRGNIVKSGHHGYTILILGNGCYSSTTNGSLSKVWGVDLTLAILSRDIRHGTSYIVGGDGDRL